MEIPFICLVASVFDLSSSVRRERSEPFTNVCSRDWRPGRAHARVESPVINWEFLLNQLFSSVWRSSSKRKSGRPTDKIACRYIDNKKTVIHAKSKEDPYIIRELAVYSYATRTKTVYTQVAAFSAHFPQLLNFSLSAIQHTSSRLLFFDKIKQGKLGQQSGTKKRFGTEHYWIQTQQTMFTVYARLGLTTGCRCLCQAIGNICVFQFSSPQ